jgi:hypothetical protein
MDEDPSKGHESLGFETCYGDEDEAMEIDEDPATKDWRKPILAWIDRGALPLTKQKHDGLQGELSRSH